MRLWNKLSLQKKLYLIFGLMAFVIVVELLVLRYAMTNLTAVRAFVYGESVWSKAQKDSAYYLKRMAMTKDKKDYEAYQKSLFVPRECRIARLELYKHEPNLELVRRGFVNGKIHPEEVGPILHMISAFAWLPHIQTALVTWKEADETLQDFEKIAENFYHAVMQGASPQVIDDLSQRLDDLNFELGQDEDRFSDALQSGARWLENVVLISLLGLVLFVELTGFLLVYFFGRDLSQRLQRLIYTSKRIQNREFIQELKVSSMDEVGELTQSINRMGQAIFANQSELENRIDERTRALREAIQTRDQFYSIASHELKTPVTAIQSSLQIMEKSLKIGVEVPKETLQIQIGKAVELSRKLNQLQDTLMDVTRINGNMFKMNMAKQDLMWVVRAAVEETKISENANSVQTKGPKECYANFDSSRIGQVISNLVKNAIRYGGGSPVVVQIEDSGKEAYIRISDNGPGIPPGHEEKIFDQFIRANDDVGVSGLGIGLFVARRIMEAHGGSLNLLSSSKGETVFLAVLPKF